MPTYAGIEVDAVNPGVAATLFVLAWTAAADGDVCQDELGELRKIAVQAGESAILSRVVQLAHTATDQDIHDACRVLARCGPEHRRLLMQLVLSIALEDGVLCANEGHVIRFVADVLSIPAADMHRLFREMTGHPFPEPANLSSEHWWRAREKRVNESSESGGEREARSQSQAGGIQRLRWLALLGLDESATQAEIKTAYRRMAAVHHPDKYATLGPEAVSAAAASFRRVQHAYEQLVGP